MPVVPVKGMEVCPIPSTMEEYLEIERRLGRKFTKLRSHGELCNITGNVYTHQVITNWAMREIYRDGVRHHLKSKRYGDSFATSLRTMFRFILKYKIRTKPARRWTEIPGILELEAGESVTAARQCYARLSAHDREFMRNWFPWLNDGDVVLTADQGHPRRKLTLDEQFRIRELLKQRHYDRMELSELFQVHVDRIDEVLHQLRPRTKSGGRRKQSEPSESTVGVPRRTQELLRTDAKGSHRRLEGTG